MKTYQPTFFTMTPISACCVLFLITAREPQTRVHAQTGQSMLVQNLGVRTVVSGLMQPTSMAFLAENTFFVLEKPTGRGCWLRMVRSRKLGLLGIALHPNFPANPGVYLYWTCQAPPPPPENPFFPTLQERADPPGLGDDTANILAVPLRGNRVDRFIWNPTTQTLTFDWNMIKLHAFQNEGAPQPSGKGDSAQPAQGNHNGGGSGPPN
jgi:hypothetical protein